MWVVTISDPTVETPVIESVTYAGTGVMMGKPIALSTGEWAFPSCNWYAEKSSQVIVTSDQGRNYSVRGAAGMPEVYRLFDEQQLVERKDGSLWMLARTKMGLAEAFSYNKGKTWTEYAPSWLQHPSARVLLRRLHSGNLLLVKHGPAVCPGTYNTWTPIGRCRLMAMLSRDDGKTWEGGLMLDERNNVSYPDGEDDAHGRIHVIYDYDRMGSSQILMATFTEADILSGDVASPTVKLRQQVSRGTGGHRRKVQAVLRNEDGERLNTARVQSSRLIRKYARRAMSSRLENGSSPSGWLSRLISS